MIQNNLAIKIITIHVSALHLNLHFDLQLKNFTIHYFIKKKTKKTHILFDIFHQDNPLNQIWIQFSQRGKIHFASPENTSEIYGAFMR